MILKVISGGQTGIDQAALRAARASGIETGGFAPKGWLTEDGPAPWLKDYGLEEAISPAYPVRTRLNVESAHATLIVDDKTFQTGGTKLTFDIAYQRGKVGGGLFVAVLGKHGPAAVADWIRQCFGARDSFVLNVAGPRESSVPGIGARAEAVLIETFSLLPL